MVNQSSCPGEQESRYFFKYISYIRLLSILIDNLIASHCVCCHLSSLSALYKKKVVKKSFRLLISYFFFFSVHCRNIYVDARKSVSEENIRTDGQGAA